MHSSVVPSLSYFFFLPALFSYTSRKIALPSGLSIMTFQLHDSQELAMCESHTIIGLQDSVQFAVEVSAELLIDCV